MKNRIIVLLMALSFTLTACGSPQTAEDSSVDVVQEDSMSIVEESASVEEETTEVVEEEQVAVGDETVEESELEQQDVIEYSFEKLKKSVSEYDGNSNKTNSVINGDTIYTMVGKTDGNVYVAVQGSKDLHTYMMRVTPTGEYLFVKEGTIYIYNGVKASGEKMEEWWQAFVECATAADGFYVKADFNKSLDGATEDQITYTTVNGLDFNINSEIEYIQAHYKLDGKEYLFYINSNTDELEQMSLIYDDGTQVSSSAIIWVVFPDEYNEILDDQVITEITNELNQVTSELKQIEK